MSPYSRVKQYILKHNGFFISAIPSKINTNLPFASPSPPLPNQASSASIKRSTPSAPSYIYRPFIKSIKTRECDAFFPITKHHARQRVHIRVDIRLQCLCLHHHRRLGHSHTCAHPPVLGRGPNMPNCQTGVKQLEAAPARSWVGRGGRVGSSGRPRGGVANRVKIRDRHGR